MSSPSIIEVALNGLTAKEVNPQVPRSPYEVTADALACIEAGAAIVHSHTDDPMLAEGGIHSAEPYLQAWRPIRERHPEVLLYATMAWRGPIADRWAHQVVLGESGLCDVGLVDPGSISLGLLGEDGLPMALDIVYENSFADARYMVERCAELGLAPSVSIFDLSWLRVALTFHAAGALPAGAMIKLYFGGSVPFSPPATIPSLDAYLAMLDGTGLQWSVAVLGGDVIECGLARAALERGGHVRVGLEDYAGPRTPTNVELVERLAELVSETGRSVASITEARRILGMIEP